MTPDNVDKVDELYSKYDRMSSAARDAVRKECKDRFDTVDLLKTHSGKEAFKVEPTCALDDAQTTVHCTVDISPASDTMKDKLAAYPTTDLTLRIWFDDSQFVVGTPDHVVDDVATATMTNGEKVTGLVWFCGPGVLRVVGCYWWCCAHWRAYWLGESQPSALWGCSSL